MYPVTTNLSFLGARKDNEIIVWDIRNPGQIFAILNRKVETNQRIYFDIDQTGRHVISGSTDGSVSVWDLDSVSSDVDSTNLPTLSHFENFHQDAINGCEIHPYLPYVATTSGQRHVKFPKICDDDNDEIMTEEALIENSLKIWSFQYLQNNEESLENKE